MGALLESFNIKIESHTILKKTLLNILPRHGACWIACILNQLFLQNVIQKVTNTPIQPAGFTGDTHIQWNRLKIIHVYQPHS